MLDGVAADGVGTDSVGIASSMPSEEHYQFLTDGEIQPMVLCFETVESPPSNLNVKSP